jgi:cytoskeletal protein RodZ
MMKQSRLAIPGWLVAVACVIVLGLVAVLVNRAVTANQGEVAPAAPEAVPKVAEPAMTSSPTAAAPSVAPITAEAAAREASWREAREATIRVQQRLRAEQQARKSAQDEEMHTERCVGGQRMRRVENGWVEAGNC